jgi:ABC-2 type transport system ATP-binding protein
MIAGILKPDSGQVCYDEIPIDVLQESYRSIFGYLPQEFGFYPEFTVRDYLEYMSALKGISSADAREKINELLERLTLKEVEKKQIRKLSGGMKRRVGIAQALLNEPEVLLLDEPTSGLDPGERIRFRNLISEFAQDKIVLISTHIVPDVEYMASRIIIMKDGRIIADGSSEELSEKMQNRVFTAMIRVDELHHYEHAVRIVNIRNVGNNMLELRYLSDHNPFPEAEVCAPHLEDYYLHMFPEEGGRESC